MKKDTKTFIATTGSIIGVLSFATLTSASFKPVEYIREEQAEAEGIYEFIEIGIPEEEVIEVAEEIQKPIPAPVEIPVVVDDGLSSAEEERIRQQVDALYAELIAQQQAEADALVSVPEPTPPKKVSKPKPSRQTNAS